MEYPFDSDGSAYEWLVKTALFFEIKIDEDGFRLKIEDRTFQGRGLKEAAEKAYDWMNGRGADWKYKLEGGT